MAVNDTSFPTPSPDEVFVDRYRRITPKWYPWMKRLFEALRTTINAVGVVEQTVDNVRGLYGVSVNANGRVTASIKLDGSPADSSFAILADKFIVVHPSVDATTIQAFVVGLVNGVPTVGINGDLIVDGTIAGEKVRTGLIESTNGKMTIDLDNGTIKITT